jgi:metal-sulfur cluster biosynthetic enzyme
MVDSADRIVEALREVHDPCCAERGISVVDMGLVRGVTVDEGNARVELILTTGWCPFVLDLLGSITERIEALPEIGGAQVEVVWDEAWSSDRLSDSARAKLRFLPHPKEAEHDR